MSELNKPTTVPSVDDIVRRPFFDGFFQGVFVAGVVGVVGCRAYHIGWHPEWTEAQSLRDLWMIYLFAITCVVFGVLWFSRR
jgi:hypothetical protein